MREKLIAFLRAEFPSALPHTRAELTLDEATRGRRGESRRGRNGDRAADPRGGGRAVSRHCPRARTVPTYAHPAEASRFRCMKLC
jgi:hypothetical protein